MSRHRSVHRSIASASRWAIAVAALAPFAATAQQIPNPAAPTTSQVPANSDRAVAPSSATVEPKPRAEQPGTPAAADQPLTAAEEDGGDAPAAAPASPQDIIIVGTRASLEAASNRKRQADTVVDSIVADDIASFPDKNVGDSLSRITGVQLSRDFGEGVQVSIRGVEPDLNRVEIDGLSQVSATGQRAGDFRELATELVKSIDVYKGYTADLTEGGIGGTVRVETRKPLDLKKPLGSIVASAQYLDTARDWRPRGTLVLGTPHFLLDGLGVLLNVTYDDKTTRQDYISNTNWFRMVDFDRSDEKTVADPAYAAFNTYASCANVGGETRTAATARRLACETQFFDWAPRMPRYRQLVRRDKRISGAFTTQYEFTSNFRGYAGVQLNRRNQRLIDSNYALDLNRFQRFNLDPALPAGLGGATSRPQVQAGTATVENHVVTSVLTALQPVRLSATVNSGSANILEVQHRNFDDDQRSTYYNTGFDWNLDAVRVTGLASYARARNISNSALISLATGIGGITLDRRNDQGLPAFVFPSAVNPADPATYADPARINDPALQQAGPTLQYRPQDNNNTEKQLKLDVDWIVDAGPLRSIEYGGQFRWQEILNYTIGGSRLITAQTPTTPAVYQPEANVTFDTQIRNTPGPRNVGSIYYLTAAEYRDLITRSSGVTSGAPLFSGLKGAPDNAPDRFAFPLFDRQVLGEYYDLSNFDQDLVRFSGGQPQIPTVRIEETIAAGYLKGNVDTSVFGMRLTGNAGVRYVHTRDRGTGTNIARVQQPTASGSSIVLVQSAQQRSVANSYTDILPAFNAALAVQPNLLLRANWARNLARPRPVDLVPNINCLDDQTLDAAIDTCTGGNPELRPYRADQWEANLSWFPNRDTTFSLGYYKKNINSFVIPNVTRADVDLFGDGILFTVRQPINGNGAVLDGVEASGQTVFSFLPGALGGFGVTGNVTYARAIRTNLVNNATGEALIRYPGLSKWTYNASIFYDRRWLNVRFNYNFRSDWLVTVLDANNGNNPIFRKGEGYLDGKITFRFPRQGLGLFLEMQNINKEYSQSFIDAARRIERYYPGQRFYAGAQLKF